MAVKPLRLQAKQVYAYVNSSPTRRVQSFDWSSNFTIDSVFELGNAGIVEDSISLVESSITANSNEWGTTDLEAMMFGIYEQRNIRGKSATVTPQSTISTLIVNAYGDGGSWSSKVAVGDWLQVVRYNRWPTTNNVDYVKVKTISYHTGKRANIIRCSPTYLLSGKPATSDLVTLVNKYTITQDTVDAQPVHFILPHRYSNTSTAMLHSIILPRCFVDNLTYRLDTGGAAEQNYTLVGEEERMLLGSRREAQSIAGSFMSYSGATANFRIPRYSLAATGSPYISYADSNLATLKRISHTSPQATVAVRFGSGLSLDKNAQYVYYFSNKTKKGYKGLTNITSGIGKLTKGYMRVEFQKAAGLSEKLLRCTGVDISIPLTRESIDELGESRSVGHPLEGNIRNEVTLTFSRNDLREYAKMLGSESAFDAGTLKEILMTNLKAVKDMTILVKLYKSQTVFDSTTLLKTFTFANCNFIGDNVTTPISGASGLDLNFSTQSLSIVGSGKPPIY